MFVEHRLFDCRDIFPATRLDAAPEESNQPIGAYQYSVSQEPPHPKHEENPASKRQQTESSKSKNRYPAVPFVSVPWKSRALFKSDPCHEEGREAASHDEQPADDHSGN